MQATKSTEKKLTDAQVEVGAEINAEVEAAQAYRLSTEEAKAAGEIIERIISNVEQVIFGKRVPIELVLTAIMAQGHVLIEDVPGVGKTSLVSAIAKSIDCGYKRIQFTPDLMPSDVTGFSIYSQKTGEFEFRSGAIMSNLVLADEINRASAKTQSSLLEAMEERQVTVDGTTYALDKPFVVLATQNPLESFGTYPLPEAQVDRFIMKMSMGYPTLSEEMRVITMMGKPKKDIQPAVKKQDIIDLISSATHVYVSPEVSRYIVEIVGATRSSADLALGSSPRGSISLNNAAKAWALIRGRDHVLPDDVKHLAPYVLSHRLSLSHEAKTSKKKPEQIVQSILQSVVVPLKTADV